MRLPVFLAALLSTTAMASPLDERQLVKEVLVDAPLEAVWKAWSTSEGIVSFFGPEAVIEPRPGGAFFVHFNPFAPAGLKGADDMRVLAVQEGRLISFTWNAPPHLPEARKQRTLVTVRLAPDGDARTRVRLRQVGWGEGGEWDQAFQYFDRAWASVLAALQKRFVEGPRDWQPFLQQMKARQDAAK